ncbi:cytochrome P450 9e2-like [Leptopilina heterotoma]|uniref:cytochrome P450 9e2-like n=1 Tax=Leptopilina heterotoma TaxID=63436 RepID=UPI001CAA050E|nr:cytochrome P450 9e2-like [Leptopilina heterotoma]
MIFQIIQIIITIITISLVIFILRTIKNQTFFKRHGVPHETPAPLFGNMLSIITKKESISDVIKKLYDTHSNAKYIGFYDFTNPVIILRDLELIKSVAVKNFESFSDHGIMGPKPNDQLFARNLFNLKGQEWHDVRSLLSPAFTPWKMKTMYNLISNSAVNFVDSLLNEMENNKIREMKEAFSRCTNDVIINCAFGITVNTMENPNNDFYILGKEATNFARLYLKIMLMRTFPFLMNILGVKLLRQKVNEFFNESISSTINTRDRLQISRPDILQLLMDSRRGNTKIDLSMEEITAQAFVIYFGAFDTTSTTMAFLAHELALNQEIQRKLQNEIDITFQNTNGEPTYDEITGLEYLDAILKETMRKYPSFAALDRICTKEFELPPSIPGGKSILIKPGMMIWIPVVGYHYDTNHYENPEIFNPDQFLKYNSENSKETFFSFGIGPRQCIGSRFAMLEMKIVFFHLLSHFNFKVCSKTNIPIPLSTKSVGFGARGGYWIELEKRENKNDKSVSM